MNVTTNNNLKSTVALAVLHNVLDPEIGLSVVDLGLIYQLDFDESNQTIYCTMTLTTQFCPMGDSITQAVKDTLENSFAGYTIEMKLTFEPAWNHERISPEGNEFLNKS